MALIKTLRRSVALFICPELGRASHRQAYRRPGLIAELRAAAPLFVPAILIDRIIIRGIDKALSPLVMAAPALEKRLQPRVSLLCGISNPSWAKRAERAALLWLLAEQEAELEPTGEAGRPGQGGKVVYPVPQGPRPEIRMPPLADAASGSAARASAVQDGRQSPPVPHVMPVQGVR